jgi:pimeloyl-ACP methyl ester carboxylesterase
MLIIPGASATPEFYAPLIHAVKRVFEIVALHIPSVGNTSGTNGMPPMMYEDVSFIQSYITKLLDANKDVIIITHSYGGTPGTQSIEWISKKERKMKGLKSGIIGLAYMTSIIPELGQPASSVQAPFPTESKVPTAIDVRFFSLAFYGRQVITHSNITGGRLDLLS